MRRSPSRWNLCLERLLAADNLSPNEGRLMHVLMRRTLGWNRSSDRVGERQLMQLCRFPFRSTLQRARKGLIEKGLIEYEPGLGAGNRSLYRMVLVQPGKGSVAPALSSPIKGSVRAQKSARSSASTEGVVRKGKIKTGNSKPRRVGEGGDRQPLDWREELTEEQLAEMEGSVFGRKVLAMHSRRPLIDDEGYTATLATALSDEYATESEIETMLAGHRFVLAIKGVPAAQSEGAA